MDNLARFVKLIEKKLSMNVENVSRSFRSRENSLCFVCSREERKEGKKGKKRKDSLSLKYKGRFITFVDGS